MSELLNFLKKNTDNIVGDIEKFVTYETPSTDKALLDEFAGFLKGFCADISGGETTRVASKKSGDNIVLRVPGAVGVKPVLMVGHYDTVWPEGTLKSMPFSIKDSIARGPGIFDMKAGLVQGLWAIRALRETGVSHPPIVFILNSDEEIGSPESHDLIVEQARAALAALVLEPSFNGSLKTERKGVGRYTLRVQGRASHAGLDPAAGISAIDEMARLVLALHAETNLGSGTTVNVGTISGGTRYNVIAAETTAEVDVRFSTMEECARMDKLIHALQTRNKDAKLSVSGGVMWPPMKRNAAIGELYETAAKLGAEACGIEHLQETSVGGASDGNTCASVGIPVLDGLGAVGGGAHAIDEHIDTRHVAARSALVAQLLSSLGVGAGKMA